MLSFDIYHDHLTFLKANLMILRSYFVYLWRHRYWLVKIIVTFQTLATKMVITFLIFDQFAWNFEYKLKNSVPQGTSFKNFLFWEKYMRFVDNKVIFIVAKYLKFLYILGYFKKRARQNVLKFSRKIFGYNSEHISVEIIYGGHSRSLCHFQENCVGVKL